MLAVCEHEGLFPALGYSDGGSGFGPDGAVAGRDIASGVAAVVGKEHRHAVIASVGFEERGFAGIGGDVDHGSGGVDLGAAGGGVGGVLRMRGIGTDGESHGCTVDDEVRAAGTGREDVLLARVDVNL